MKKQGWRIVGEAQAAMAFSGEGARLYGGRWNSVGVPLVYASEHLAMAALEVRVHIDQTRMRKRYVAIAFEYEESFLERWGLEDMPAGWKEEPPPRSVQERGDEWVRSGRSLMLALPSVIIPQENNLLINPRHPDFEKLVMKPPVMFSFDPRLLA
jgi:RES domain-containing protein